MRPIPLLMKTPRPHRQGSLDSLCGVYSILNSTGLVLRDRMNASDGQRLFSRLMLSLGANAPRMIVDGLHLWQFVDLMRKTTRILKEDGITVRFRRAFPVRPGTLQEFWRVIERHQAQHGNGSVVFGMEGAYSHWTCINRVAPDGLHLADSSDIAFLPRRQCTIARCSSARPYRLLPTQTFLLTRGDHACDRSIRSVDQKKTGRDVHPGKRC